MRSFILLLFPLLLLSQLVVIVSPTIVFAQDNDGGLVTCTGVGSDPCTFCDVIQTGNNVIELLFEILIVAAIIMVVIAGLRLVTSQGNANAMEQAKSMLTNVIIGFVIVLSAWLIVDTIFKMLVGDNQNFGIWNNLDTSSCNDGLKSDQPVQDCTGAQCPGTRGDGQRG